MSKTTAGILVRIMANNAIRNVLDLNIDSTKAFEKIEIIVCEVQEIDEVLGLRGKLEEENIRSRNERDNSSRK